MQSSNDEEEDSEGDDESDTEDSNSYKTPCSRTPKSRFRPLGPLSMSATPGAEFVSPSLLQPVNRSESIVPKKMTTCTFTHNS